MTTNENNSSRLIIKNIGKNITEDELKKIFNRYGEITDIKIKKTKNGKTREFAFIGYKNSKQASETLKYFNQTFIKTSKISIEFAKSINDQNLLNISKSRYTKKKLEKILLNNKKLKENEIKNKKNIKKLNENKNNIIEKSKIEFLEVMKTRNNANIWGNDDGQLNNQQQFTNQQQQQLKRDRNNNEDEENESENEEEEEESDEEEEYNEINKNKNNKLNKKNKSNSNSDSDSNSDVESDSEDEIVKGKSNSSSKNLKSSNVISDLDFLRGKVKKNITEDSDDDGDDSNSNSGSESDNESQDENDENEKIIPETSQNESDDNNDPVDVDKEGNDDDNEEEGRLFIRNLPYSVSEDELKELFSQYGPISQIHLPLNEDKRGKGYGFIQFMIPEHGKNAIKELDGTSFQGRLLHIIPARAQISHSEENSQKNSHLSSFQKKKEDERKKQANKREGWNASYVRSDTVIDSLSDKYGVSRGDILDTDGAAGGELAVRLAIGETQIIQENKEYFLSHGVDTDSLESALSSAKSSSSSSKVVERSTTTLLIKNLPHDCVAEELEEMFSKFGSISSFLLPPSKTVALIDFTEPTDARRAFTNLAYRRYHHVPIYLEWAPLNTMTKNKSSSKINNTQESSSDNNPTKRSKKSKETSINTSNNSNNSNTTSIDDSADYSTLYLKNLNFITTEDDLESHLTLRLGINKSDIRAISIPKKQSKSGQLLSMGYGFIEFKTIQGAVNMLTRINGSRLNEYIIEAKPSDKRLSIPQQSLLSSSKQQNSLNSNNTNSHNTTTNNSSSNHSTNSNETNKLIIRNVAFQATKNELKTLFSSFGTIKTLRIPRKIGGNHRGFAFIDFNTKQEATRAMNALSRTHLYGRHLVIEYAENNDNEEINEEKNEKEKVELLRNKAEKNMKMIQKLSQNKKRKVGEILDSQDNVDLMMV